MTRSHQRALEEVGHQQVLPHLEFARSGARCWPQSYMPASTTARKSSDAMAGERRHWFAPEAALIARDCFGNQCQPKRRCGGVHWFGASLRGH